MWKALQILPSSISKFSFAFEPRHVLPLLLLVTFLKGWVWSVVVPVWEVYDENEHVGYVQEIIRQSTLRLSPPQETTEELWLLWNLAPPLRLSYQREPLDLSSESLSQMNAIKSRLYTQAVHTNLVPSIWSQGAIIQQHPPLYYTLQAIIHQLGAERNILVRMAWMRLLSVLMGVAAIACVYGMARTLWPDQTWLPIAVATLVSFHPFFTFFTSAVHNQALELLCFAALGWLVVSIARNGMTWLRGLMLGMVLAAGLLTKTSFLATVPLVVTLLGWNLIRTKKRFHWIGWMLVILLPLVLASWWYLDLWHLDILETRDTLYGPFHLSSPNSLSNYPLVSIPLLRYLFDYPWFDNYRFFLREWWGAFGWRDTFYPSSIYLALEVLTLLAFLGFGWWYVRFWGKDRRREQRESMYERDLLAIIAGIVSTLSLIGFYTAIDCLGTINCGGFKIVGRYFLAAIAPQMIALTTGWMQFRGRWILPALCAGMIALNLYTLVGLIIPRYYGEQIVVRNEPVDRFIELGPDAVVRRTFSVEGKGISRIDVWLKKTTEIGDATLSIYAWEETMAQMKIPPQQMLAPYPTILRFQAPPIGGEYAVEIRGNGGKLNLSSDENLAIKAYQSVPPLDIPARMSVLQPHSFSTFYILALGAGYLFFLSVYISAGMSLIAREGARDNVGTTLREQANTLDE